VARIEIPLPAQIPCSGITESTAKGNRIKSGQAFGADEIASSFAAALRRNFCPLSRQRCPLPE